MSRVLPILLLVSVPLILSGGLHADDRVGELLEIVGASDGDFDRLEQSWKELDIDGDGRVALDELPADLSPALGRADIDEDGAISLEEFVIQDLDRAGASRIPLSENVRVVSHLPYAATEDARQRLDVYLPKTPSVEGPLPVVAYVHGGGWQAGSKIMARTQVMDLVDSGRFAAISIGYRLAWQDPWPAQIHDVKAGIRWIRAHAEEYGLDPSRICAMGASAGGQLVAVLGTTSGVDELEGSLGTHIDHDSSVQCVVDFFGPSDFTDRAVSSDQEPREVHRLFAGNADLAIQASALHHVDETAPPFLIVHGTEDPVVDYEQSVKLAEALQEAGVPVVFQTIEGGGHGTFGTAIEEINQRVRAFLESNFYDDSVVVPAGILTAGQ